MAQTESAVQFIPGLFFRCTVSAGENGQQIKCSSVFDNTSTSGGHRSSVGGAFNSLDINSSCLQAGLSSTQQLAQQHGDVLNYTLSCITSAVVQALLPQTQVMQQQQQMPPEQQQLAHLQHQLCIQSAAKAPYGRHSVMISSQSAKPASSSPQQLSVCRSSFRLPGVFGCQNLYPALNLDHLHTLFCAAAAAVFSADNHRLLSILLKAIQIPLACVSLSFLLFSGLSFSLLSFLFLVFQLCTSGCTVWRQIAHLPICHQRRHRRAWSGIQWPNVMLISVAPSSRSMLCS